MENRSKRAKQADSNFKAMGKGERTSKKVSTIRTASGTSFRRKNANQYGAAEGGNDYTEKRVNRTDSFETGGTADSAENGGANVGGTLGSSMMKKGGSTRVVNEYRLAFRNDKGKIIYRDSEGVSVGDAYNVGKWREGIENDGFKFIPTLTKVIEANKYEYKTNEMANGGGLANVPESFPETDAMSYKKGGSTVKDNRMNERTRAVILKIQKTGIHPDDVSPNFVNEIAYDNGIELKSEEVVFISDNYGKKSMAKGGSTKGFEYSIGGL
jgi:hypothetical protein